MLTLDKTGLLKDKLAKIFAFPLCKITLNEVQSAVRTLFPQVEQAQKVLEAFFKEGAAEELGDAEMQALIEEFAPRVRLAKEIHDYGDFINIFSCDFLQKGNQVYFMNQMRKIDGNDFYFLSAPETNIRLAHMFINRLRDLKTAVGNLPLDDLLMEELQSIKKEIEELLKPAKGS